MPTSSLPILREARLDDEPRRLGNLAKRRLRSKQLTRCTHADRTRATRDELSCDPRRDDRGAAIEVVTAHADLRRGETAPRLRDHRERRARVFVLAWLVRGEELGRALRYER